MLNTKAKLFVSLITYQLECVDGGGGVAPNILRPRIL